MKLRTYHKLAFAIVVLAMRLQSLGIRAINPSSRKSMQPDPQSTVTNMKITLRHNSLPVKPTIWKWWYSRIPPPPCSHYNNLFFIAFLKQLQRISRHPFKNDTLMRRYLWWSCSRICRSQDWKQRMRTHGETGLVINIPLQPKSSILRPSMIFIQLSKEQKPTTKRFDAQELDTPGPQQA